MREDRFDRPAPHALDAAQLASHQVAQVLRKVRGPALVFVRDAVRIALHDRGPEKSLAPRRYEMESDRHCTGTLAPDRYAIRITSERADVALHPQECELLIEEAVVTGQPV